VVSTFANNVLVATGRVFAAVLVIILIVLLNTMRDRDRQSGFHPDQRAGRARASLSVDPGRVKVHNTNPVDRYHHQQQHYYHDHWKQFPLATGCDKYGNVSRRYQVYRVPSSIDPVDSTPTTHRDPRSQTRSNNTISDSDLAGPLSYAQVIELMSSSQESEQSTVERSFAVSLSNTILSSPSKAVFWECVSVTPETAQSTTFELVVLPANALAEKLTDFQSFNTQLDTLCKGAGNRSAISFPNLGADATLVVPCPRRHGRDNNFTHLKAFLSLSNPQEQAAFWSTVGETLSTVLNLRTQPGPTTSTDRMGVQAAAATGKDSHGRRIWLSTSGLGVYYLHVRIDSSPKYYQYSDYK